MLKLQNIVKTYKVGDIETHALKGVSIEFRENEFVSILGPSGCGKTTMLNIVGGLDRYTSGDLFINGKSTKQFKDGDWDVYRNESIGFVFQSYNLIPHQSVLANVELALTLSGVSKTERRKKATEMLKKVGLGDHLHKRPNQLSGGQMQRVAIARSLINDPDILLADEPTGALDTETSVQIMELLKEIAEEKLVIMVTHNPELAQQYSTRIIKLLDGEVVDDSDPFTAEVKEEVKATDKKKSKKKKISLKHGTALSLSLNNLMTKKGRTFMTSFAGSIGIIGIALILSLSSGFQGYIDKVQEDTLSTYPITIESQTVDMSSMLEEMTGTGEKEEHPLDKIYANTMMSEMINAMVSEVKANDLAAFKTFIEDNGSNIKDYLLATQYTYNIDMNIYRADTENGNVKVNPSVVYQSVMENMGMSVQTGSMASSIATAEASMFNVFTEMLDNEEVLHSQYDVISGDWPKNANEVVLIVDENNEINDMVLYTLGIKDQDEMQQMQQNMLKGEEVKVEATSYEYDELVGLTFKLVHPADYYVYDEASGTYVDKSKDEAHLKSIIDAGEEIKIVGILRPNEDATATSIGGAIGYTRALTEKYINATNEKELVKKQLENTDVDVFTGIEFPTGEEKEITIDDVNAYVATLPADQQAQMGAYMSQMTEDQIIASFGQYVKLPTTDATLEGNKTLLGIADLSTPATINLYAKDFESKDMINDIIEDYNKSMEDKGEEGKKINYTDYVGILMSSITTIINIISYVLIAFVSISLIVSSIMIGIITYISVLERTKEIGILRSIGASKKDISRVFNAETFIMGLTSGIIGIVVTLIIDAVANIILDTCTSIPPIVHLPAIGGIILIIISTVLTLIAGLIPAKVAANKDPVEALRSE